MRIKNHRLIKDDGTHVDFIKTSKMSGRLDPRYLVMHYTAGSSAESAIRTLTDPSVSASAHLVIGRDGAITQLVPFNRVAWHAGYSRWQGLTGLNAYSLGIELDNAGPMTRQGTQWRTWFGRLYDEEDVVEAIHKHDDEPRGWHVYSEAQLDAAMAVGTLLVSRYELSDVIGHDDIAPDRKRDPGPAFPMESFRARVIGRREDEPEIFETTTHLNMREGPGTWFDRLAVSPLPPGTRLILKGREGVWHEVELRDEEGLPDWTGWVHGDYIRAIA